MRKLLGCLLVVVSGCQLYFGDGPHGDPPYPYPPPDAPVEPPPPPDAFPVPPPDPAPDGSLMARCEDGVIRVVPNVLSFPDDPAGHGEGRVIGSCGSTCRSAAVVCDDFRCANSEELCNAPVSRGAVCPLEGAACAPGEAIDCPEVAVCGEAVPGSTCACVDGTYQCDQVTPTAATQAQLVGKWRGVVTTPGFTPPYAIELWIYPDGTYWADCDGPNCIAFYYGGDGPSPDRKITLQSTTPMLGAIGDILIEFGPLSKQVGAISGLVVNTNSLRFTYRAAWHGCGQPFDVNLTRAP